MEIRAVLSKFLLHPHAVRRLIAINVCVFLVVELSKVVLFLFGFDTEMVQSVLRWLKLPAAFTTWIVQPWSLLTAMFLHSGFFHLLFNMLWLYWIGSIFHEYLGNRKVYECYFTGGLFGALLFMLSYHIFPAFRPVLDSTFAVGASAGVLAIVAATATLLPDYTIGLLFFGQVKLKYIAIATVLLDVILIPGSNSGGHIAHIGGALSGFLYIKYTYAYGQLIPESWYRFFSRSRSVKVYYKNTTSDHRGGPSKPSQQEVDLLLDKISKTGYESLSKKEKETLFKASKE